MRALAVAATGMSAQQTRVEVISHNLANMNTTAFNARRAEFSDLNYQQYARPGEISAADGTVLPTGIQLGMGVRPTAVSVHLAQGALVATNGDLDLAIDGDGFFEVQMPSGESAYTRDGGFKRTAEGQIVTSQGHPLAPEIVVPEDAKRISINADGEVFAYFDLAAEAQQLGQITLVRFANPRGLEAFGGNLFAPTAASGPGQAAQPGTEGLGRLQQGYLEESSVNAVKEVTELIKAQRGYEMNAKVISAADQMLGATTQIR